MLLRVEVKNQVTKETFFENFNTIRLAEVFCKGLLYGHGGFEALEIVDMDHDKRYKYSGEPHYILKEV